MSATCIALLKIAPLKAEEETTVAAVLSNLRAGIRFVRDTPSLRSLFLVFTLVFVLFGFLYALNLPFAINALGLGEFEYGLIEGVAMVGFVLGSLVMANWADRLHEGQWIALSLLGMGIAAMLYAASTTLLMAIVFNGLVMFMNAPSYIGRQLLI